MYSRSNKIISRIFTGIAGVLVFTISGISYAATGPAPQSEDTTVSITIPDIVSITELDDIAFGIWDGLGDEQGTDNLCVWVNNSGLIYQVTVTSSTLGYTLDNAGTGTTIDFAVAWSNLANQTVGTNIPYNTKTQFALSAATTPTCGGAGNTNSTIMIDITEAELLAQETSANPYQAVLTVTIEVQP